MKKITLLLIVLIGLSFSTQSFADGDLLKSKTKNPINSFKVLVEDITVNFSIKFFRKSNYRIVLFTENGEFMKVLEEGKDQADYYSYELEKENLPQGEYICLIETENSVITQFFKIEERLDKEKIQVNFDKLNHSINIQSDNKDYTVNVFSEDGTFLKTFQVNGQQANSNICIHTSGWDSGDYFIHVECDNKIISQAVKI